MKHQHNLAGKFFTVLMPFCVACSGGDDAGDDAASANQWNGKTYLLEMQNKFWAEPKSAIQDLAPYVRGFLVEVNGESADSYQATVATLKLNSEDLDPPPAPEQDMCTATSSMSGSGNSVSGDLKMNIRHAKEEINVLTTARRFSLVNVLPTNEELVSTFAATLDAREISKLFTQIDSNTTPQQLCDTLAQLEIPAPCEPCPQDGQSWCLTITATHKRDFRATETALKIQPVSDADAASAACSGGLAP